MLGFASEVGTLTAREAVASPYSVGAPVPADRLLGRLGVFDQIRSAWAKPGQRDSLVVYGHRRRRLPSRQRRPSTTTFAESDVDALIASKALYEQRSVYYRGIWQQAAEGPTGQHALLRALAAHPEGLDEAVLGQLAAIVAIAGGGLTEALQALREHDVLIAEAGRYRYTVELMRLWVLEHKP